jgi:RHS repeat-associated protein
VPAPPIASSQLREGTSVRVEYNSKGKVCKYIDPVGRETRFTYGTNNVPDADCVSGDSIDLLRIEQVNPSSPSGLDLIESRTYDAQHQLLTSTDASGQTWTYTYTPTGQLETEVSPERNGPDGNPLTLAERTTTHEYYPIGAPTGEGWLEKTTGPSSPQGSPTTDYTYDTLGRVETVTDTDGYTVAREHDALDRLTKLSFPDGTIIETVYDKLDPARRRDRLGRWTHSFYDALRRPTAIRDPLGRTVTYRWCNCGSLDGIVDPEENKTTWERDVQGRVKQEVRANGATKVFTYEATTSRLKELKDAKDQVKEYEYELDGRLKRIAYRNSLGQPDPNTPEVVLAYDPNYPWLSSRTDGGVSTTTYTHHPVTVPPTLGALHLASIDGPLPNDTIGYQYDELGRVASRAIDGVAATQEFDALGRVEETTNALGTFTYAYEGPTNRVSSMDFPNGQTTTISYLGNLGDHRLTEIHHQLPGGATLLKHGYTSDAVGRINTWSQTEGTSPATMYELGYDAADQLLSATLRTTVPSAVSKSYSYRYDGIGNRTVETVDQVVTSASHDDMNRLESQQVGGALRFAGFVDEPAVVTVGGSPAQVAADNSFEGTAPVVAGTNTVEVVAQDYAQSPGPNTRTNTYEVEVTGSSGTLTYDASGNLESDGVRSFEWDVENRLLAVTQGTLRSEFGYDGLSRRVSIVEKDGPTVLSSRRLLWCDETTLCEERDSSGTTVLKRFVSQGEIQGADSFFYARDHLGSVRLMTDASATVRAGYDYDPYGRVSKTAGDRDAMFGFTGHLHHVPTGLTLAPYRAYDPNLGRWVSEDPISLAGGDLNLYAYVGNDPINGFDPTGQFAFALPLVPPALVALGKAAAATAAVFGLYVVTEQIVEEIVEPAEDVEVPETEPPKPRTQDGQQEPVRPEPEPIKVPVPPFDPEIRDPQCEPEPSEREARKKRKPRKDKKPGCYCKCIGLGVGPDIIGRVDSSGTCKGICDSRGKGYECK